MYKVLDEEKAMSWDESRHGLSKIEGKQYPNNFYNWEIRKDNSGKVMLFESEEHAKMQIISDRLDEKAHDLPEVIERKTCSSNDIIIIPE